jgi:hypothetical protein
MALNSPKVEGRMIPLVAVIEDLDAVIPEDARIRWDEGGENDFALVIESELRSFRFTVDSDTLVQRGEPYRKFLIGIARVLGVTAVEFPNRRTPDRAMVAAA